ncbi:MAG: DUF1816 domain-containing protein [Thermosynechococcaceae cyanobacterium]
MDALQNCVLQIPELGWWLEVGTDHPLCIYYFGPFTNQAEAEAAKDEHLNDIRHEHADIVYAKCKFCQPRKLTIYEYELTMHDLELCPPTFFEALVMR